MPDEIAQVLERLRNLESKVRDLETSKLFSDQALKFERLPPNTTVGKDYVAYRFGCSENSVIRREAGTHLVPRISNKPVKFIKSEVDSAWRKYTRPAKKIAAELSATSNARSRSGRSK